jgi:AcrR family transcriptional regulator
MRDGSKTKLLIEQTALALFVEKGIHGATVRDIAHRAKIAEGSLYRHYTSKDALAKALYVQIAQKVGVDVVQVQQDSMDVESYLSRLVIYLCGMYDATPLEFQYVFLSQPSTLQYLDIDAMHPFHLIKSLFGDYLMMRAHQMHRDVGLLTAEILGVVLGIANACTLGHLNAPMATYADDLMFGVFQIVRQ